MADNELFGISEQLEKDHFADPGNMVGDLISRQAALGALGERPVVWSDNDDYTLGARNQYDMDRLAIETVPSAQPEIIRCKDCKYARLTNDGSCKYCDIWFPDEAEYMDGDYYCASAERKSNG